MATVIQFQQNIEEEATLIDVRTPGEFLEGHIEGAINIDFLNPNFVNEINKLDKNKEYAIYCRSGNRSSAAAKILKDNGFKEVVELSGGILSWEASGMNICYNC